MKTETVGEAFSFPLSLRLQEIKTCMSKGSLIRNVGPGVSAIEQVAGAQLS